VQMQIAHAGVYRGVVLRKASFKMRHRKHQHRRPDLGKLNSIPIRTIHPTALTRSMTFRGPPTC
jgi:hypothetical protein